MNLPVFKIRASAIGQIMGKMSGGITDKQAEELKKLQAKPLEGKGCLTDNMKSKIKELLEKKDTVKGLPKGCKTYLKNWVKEQVYGRRKEVTSKHMEKGNICEDKAIEMLIDYYQLGYNEKNEKYFSNDYMTGTPDLFYDTYKRIGHRVDDRNIVFDTKCSFDMSTFPLFEEDVDKDYWWQLQSYMELANINKAGLVYVLTNTPDHIVDSEVFYKTKGMFDCDADALAQEIRDYHNYDSIEMKFRIKRYDFNRDEQAIDAVKARVIMCRKYINDIMISRLI